MNLTRGFRRIAWVVVSLAVVPVALLSYEESRHVVGYRPRLLVAEFPILGDHWKQAVVVKDVGIVWLPSYLTAAQVVERMEALVLPPPEEARNGQKLVPVAELASAVREAYVGVNDDVMVVKKCLSDHPEYRARTAFYEYEVDEVTAYRPWWAFGATLLAMGILAAVLQGTIVVCVWIGRGFGGR